MKTKYFAIDANGERHTRSSERAYSHMVVFKDDFAREMALSTDKSWAKQDARNFDYYARIAAGNDPYPSTNFRAEHPDRFTADEIAESQARADAENARRLADAKEKTDGHDAASYIAACKADRIARLEAKKAKGAFDIFRCAGWCGRLDLAQKLAAKTIGLEITILAAQS